MKAVICGANQIGSSIAAYLSKENNDITIIDANSDALSQIANSMDVNTVDGFPSDPNTLKNAGADDCDLIIAVTGEDEVNMVACQIAHSLFGIPKKAACIRNQSYLSPTWANLFSRSHIPIDVIISPEHLIAEDIFQRLITPGATNAFNLCGDKAYLIGLICMEECPLINTPLEQITQLFPDLLFSIISLTRRGKQIFPDHTEMLEEGDEIFLVIDTRHIRRVMAAFGHREKEAHKLVISGGGNTGEALIRKLQNNFKDIQIKVIECNELRAQYLSEHFSDIITLHGSTLEYSILEEASISNADAYIALMNDDENNILGSLLAKEYGCDKVVTLVNNSAYYPLTGPLGIDMMISPKPLIVSKIMQYVRRGRIISMHSINGGKTEVTEIDVSENSSVTNSLIEELELPTNVIIGAIIRNKQFIIPEGNEQILAHDRLIVVSPSDKSREVEELFSVHVELI